MIRFLTQLLVVVSLVTTLPLAAKGDMRIVSLSPHTTEILFALGVEKSVVGVSQQCDYPPSVAEKSRVGTMMSPSFEQILALKPGLVLGSELNPRATIEALGKSGSTIRISAPKLVGDIPADIRAIGRDVGASVQASTLAADIEGALARYGATAKERSRAGKNRFLALVQVNPPIAAAPKSWLGDIFSRGGYENIVKQTEQPWPKLSREFLYTQVPDVVFVDRGALVEKRSEAEVTAEVLKLWEGRKPLPRVAFLPRDVLMRPGPRIVEGLRLLQEFR
jgi:iron complex transport system substrate-binding protein